VGKKKQLPEYDLEEVQDLIRKGQWSMSDKAERDILNRDLTLNDALDIVCKLSPSQFQKSMESNNADYAGSWQDEYRYCVGNDDWYIKVQVLEDEEGIRKARIVSFRPWGVH
jgi:motility quorum-sensing regulator/GCU-specific mRNA interferase toxin